MSTFARCFRRSAFPRRMSTELGQSRQTRQGRQEPNTNRSGSSISVSSPYDVHNGVDMKIGAETCQYLNVPRRLLAFLPIISPSPATVLAEFRIHV
jgi:hypothetical protein